MNKQKGLSLFEILLVLTLASLIGVNAFRYVTRYHWEQDLKTIQQHVKSLFTVGGRGFYLFCGRADKPFGRFIPMGEAVTLGLVKTVEPFLNPWGVSFVLFIDNTVSPTEMRIIGNFTRLPGNGKLTDSLVKALGGARTGENQVTWRRSPQFTTPEGVTPFLGGLSRLNAFARHYQLGKKNQCLQS